MVAVFEIIGVVLGIALAFFVTSVMVKKSNDFGNSKGNYKDFVRHPVAILDKKDSVEKDFCPPPYMD